MKLGTSLRFLYPTGAHTHAPFEPLLAATQPGGFVERPRGAADTVEQARNVVHREAAARAGRPVLPVLRRDICVGESDTEAEATVGRVLAEGYRGTGMVQLRVGGAKSVVEQLHSYGALGFVYVMVRHIVGEHGAMLRWFERIGRSLMPAIRSL